MKVIIIDDETPARDIVKNFLSNHSDVEICAEYSDGFSALKGIKEHNPDLIFLDVQMPKITGFEMLEIMDDYPEIIFTTAYDQYAIEAFSKNAVDYILKPFSKDRFNQALEKARIKITANSKIKDNISIKKIANTIAENHEILLRIVVKKRGNIHVIPVSDITHIEAQDDYVMIHTEADRFLKENTMKYYESHLDSQQFVRVHRSFIVRVDEVKRLEPYGKSSYIAILSKGQKVNVSLSGYKKLKEVLSY